MSHEAPSPFRRCAVADVYEIGDRLGEGAFAKVVRATRRADDAVCALKIYKRDRLLKQTYRAAEAAVPSLMMPSSSGAASMPPMMPLATPSGGGSATGTGVDRLVHEVTTLQLLQPHAHVLRLVDAVEDGDKLCIVSEQLSHTLLTQAQRGDGDDRLRFTPPAAAHAHASREAWAVRVATGLMRALSHLREHRVAHCDVKPDNVMVRRRCSASSGEPCTCEVVLVDFGLCKTGDAAERTRDAYGTLAFAPPESLTPGASAYNSMAADVWAAGVTVYTCFYGCLPFEAGAAEVREGASAADAMVASILHAPLPPLDRPRTTDNTAWVAPSSDMIAWMQRVLCKDAAVRATPAEALAHAWLA